MNLLARLKAMFTKRAPQLDWSAPDSCVLVTFGQSNSANYGPLDACNDCDALDGVYQLTPDGKVAPAVEPLSRADGIGASVWPRMAAKMIKQGLYRQVLIVSVGVGSTYVRQWVPGADHWVRLASAFHDVTTLRLRPTLICFHQGESDVHANPCTEQEYKDFFYAIVEGIRSHTDAPIFIAKATYFMGRTGCAIQRAQHMLPEILRPKNVFAGPDTDKFGPAYRHDGVHLNVAGLDAHARAWVDCIYWWKNGKAT